MIETAPLNPSRTEQIGDVIDSSVAFGIQELQKEKAFMLPLRLFIGLGWLRAFAEKLIDPTWYSGAKLTEFLTTQLSADLVYFPFVTIQG